MNEPPAGAASPGAHGIRRRLPRWVPYFNALARPLLALGVPMGPDALITIRGRKTGLPRTTPVTICENAGRRGLIAPFGESNWARNLRASGVAMITLNRRREQIRAVELDHQQAVEFFREVLVPAARRSVFGSWFVRHVDKIDIDDPEEAVLGRPVFEIFPPSPTRASQADGHDTRTANLVLRNLIFTVLVPGTAAVYVPWLMLGSARTRPAMWPAVVIIVAGVALYAWCILKFTTAGKGTPAPWDAPPHFVAVGPYRWVRNPMYISALTVILGEAILFVSVPLLAYAGAMALFFHLFVIGYEEPTLLRRFGATYAEYQRSVNRWLPRPP